MNQIVLLGRLTKDPELRHTQSGTAVASFTLAVNRPSDKNGERNADFINCVAWKGAGETIAKYLTKGKQLCVSGNLQTRSYKDKDGNNRTAYEVNVRDFDFCGSRSDSNTSTQDYAELTDDDGDLPF